jgi:hypothetical protein
MRAAAEIQAEVTSLTAQIREPQEDDVLKSLIVAREALEWAAGRASCRPTNFVIEPPSEFDVVELGERAAKALSKAERLRADVALAFLGGLSAAQLDGTACAYCHTAAAEGGAMVPLKVVAGLEYTGAHHTLFICEPDCREAKLLEGWAE